MILTNHSVKLPVTGQLSNHFIEGMRKIYELEPFYKDEIFSCSSSELKDQRSIKRLLSRVLSCFLLPPSYIYIEL